MAPVDNETPAIPAAPSYLPIAQQKQWQATYAKALQQAQIDTPGNDRAQRAAATKAANAMLAVPAPQSAADIDKLAGWQVLQRGTRDGSRFCVTTDGRKYSFPVKDSK